MSKKRINKSPRVTTRETDLTVRANSPIFSRGKSAGSFDGSIFQPTEGDGGGVSPEPTTTTTTTDSETTTTSTTESETTTTSTTDNNGGGDETTTTSTTDNNGGGDETTTTSTTESETTTTSTTDNGETTTTTTEEQTTTTSTTEEQTTTTSTTEDVTTTTTTEDVTTTTTTEDVTTTTTTIDYESLPYRLVTMRQATIDGAGYVYRYTNKDLNGDFLYNDFEVKCIEETYPNGSNSSINIGNENSVDEYLSVGDSELVRFDYVGSEVTGVYNSTARGIYSDTDLRLGAAFDKYIINIIAGEIISIVSFDSIGDASECNPPTTTTTTTIPFSADNVLVTSSEFNLNNIEIQEAYGINPTGPNIGYHFNAASNEGTLATEIFELIEYSHKQENEWSGYLDGDIVPISVGTSIGQRYYDGTLAIGSQLYDQNSNPINFAFSEFIHTELSTDGTKFGSTVTESLLNEDLTSVQQNGGTLQFITYDVNGIVTSLINVMIDFTGTVYPIDTTESYNNENFCFKAKNLAGDDWYFTNEEIKKAWNTETFANSPIRIAVSDVNEGSLSVGDVSLVSGSSQTDIDSFTDFDGDTKGVYYDIYKRFDSTPKNYVITIEGGEVTGIVSFDDINDISYNPQAHTKQVRRIYEPNVVLSYNSDFDFNRGTDYNGVSANTAQELKCAIVDLGPSSATRPGGLQNDTFDYRRDFGFKLGAEMFVSVCTGWQTSINGRFVYWMEGPSGMVDGVYHQYDEEIYIAEVTDGVLTSEPIKISEEHLAGISSFGGGPVYRTKLIEDGSDGFDVCKDYTFNYGGVSYFIETQTTHNGETYVWNERSLGSGEYIHSDSEIECLYELGTDYVAGKLIAKTGPMQGDTGPLSVGDDDLKLVVSNGTATQNYNGSIRGVLVDTNDYLGRGYTSWSGTFTPAKLLIDIVGGEVISIKNLNTITPSSVCPPITTTTTTMSGLSQFASLQNIVIGPNLWFNGNINISKRNADLEFENTLIGTIDSTTNTYSGAFPNITTTHRFTSADGNTYPGLGDVIYQNEYSQLPVDGGRFIAHPSNLPNNTTDYWSYVIVDGNGIVVEITPLDGTTTDNYVVTSTTRDGVETNITDLASACFAISEIDSGQVSWSSQTTTKTNGNIISVGDYLEDKVTEISLTSGIYLLDDGNVPSVNREIVVVDSNGIITEIESC